MNASPAVLSSCPKTVVIGAGVIGLGIAWRLAQAGCKVSVYDRAAAGGGASRAAAGMLAAAVETEPGEERLLTLTLESQRLWPDFARELEAASGIAVEYRDEGTMVVALTRDDTAQLRHNYEFQKALGLDLEWLSGAEARRREPHLRPGLPAAVLSPRDHQVDNRRLAAALALALRAACGTSIARFAKSPWRAIVSAVSSPRQGRRRPMSSCSPPAPGRGKSAASRAPSCRRCGRSRVKCWP